MPTCGVRTTGIKLSGICLEEGTRKLVFTHLVSWYQFPHRISFPTRPTMTTKLCTPVVLTIRGPPGSGKSELASDLQQQFRALQWTCTVFCTDSYRKDDYPKAHREPRTGLSDYDADAAHDHVTLAIDVDEARRPRHTAAAGCLVIVEGTALPPTFPSDYAMYLTRDKLRCFLATQRRAGRRKPTHGYFHYVAWPHHVARTRAWLAAQPAFRAFAGASSGAASSVVVWIRDGGNEAGSWRTSPFPEELAPASLADEIDVAWVRTCILAGKTESLPVAGSYGDRVLGMFLLHALGDALGAAYEFYTKDKPTYLGRLEHLPRMNTRAGRKAGICGQTTDDTAMTIALLHALRKNDWVYNRDKVLGSYLYWASSNTMAMGRNTRRLLSVRTLKGYEGRRVKFAKEMEASHSNGPLMRCAPLALIADADARAAAVETDCDLTNTSEYNKSINHAYVAHLVDALAGHDALRIDARYKDLDESLLADRERNISGKDKGLAGHSYWCALHAATRFPRSVDVHTALDWVIIKGGDTDTNAAIAGALLGARTGLAALLRDERTRTHLAKMLHADTAWTDLTCGGDWYHPRQYKTLLDRWWPTEEAEVETSEPVRKRARLE